MTRKDLKGGETFKYLNTIKDKGIEAAVLFYMPKKGEKFASHRKININGLPCIAAFTRYTKGGIGEEREIVIVPNDETHTPSNEYGEVSP